MLPPPHHLIVLLAGLLGFSWTSNGFVSNSCLNPPPHRVASRVQAILDAREAWECRGWPGGVGSKDDWLANYDAQLVYGTWHVGVRLPPGYVGGGLNTHIAHDTGRIIDMVATQ